MPVKIPSPQECGLPPKYDRWRNGQEEALDLLLNNKKRITALCAPTGFGKSGIVVAAAIQSKVPTCIVTNSRGLQDQYLDEFECIGLTDIRGRNNYSCDLHPEDPDYSCEQGYASRCTYRGTVACECSAAEMKAAASPLVITNYAKWCAARKFGQGMEHFQHVIFDEGHDSFDALASSMQVTISFKEAEGLQMDFPDHSEAEEFINWKRWASIARMASEAAVIAAQARITGVADPKPSWVRHFTHMRNLHKRIITLALARPDDWIAECLDTGYQFDPIRPGRYTESALLFGVPRVTFVSATLRPKSMYMLGIAKDKFEFREFSSDFDPKRCPIYYVPTARVDARNESSLPFMWALMDRIMSKRRDRKGIVQTTSYQYQQQVQSASRFSESMLLNMKGEAPTEVIELFKSAAPGTTLVSPSVGTGYDFPDDACRWQFILKVPFDPPSKIMKAREQDDKEYRYYRAMQKLVQSFGRDVRSKKDWSERFIGDEHFGWFRNKYAHLAPASFHGFVKEVSMLPQPPKLGTM